LGTPVCLPEMREEPQVKTSHNFPIPSQLPLNSPLLRILLPYAHLSRPTRFLAGALFVTFLSPAPSLSIPTNGKSPRPRRSQRHDDPHHSPSPSEVFFAGPPIHPTLPGLAGLEAWRRSAARSSPRRFRLHKCRSRLTQRTFLPSQASRLDRPSTIQDPAATRPKNSRRNRAPPRSH